MTIDYMVLLSKNHEEIEVTCNGATSDYNNLTFKSTVIDKAILDAEHLDYYKYCKNLEIDNRTSVLITQGFVYDSVVFSTSETAQRNWMGIAQFSADLTYPFPVTTQDDNEYMLADAAEVHTFVLTAMGTIESYYASGRSLKVAVNAATTEAEVDAVVDNR